MVYVTCICNGRINLGELQCRDSRDEDFSLAGRDLLQIDGDERRGEVERDTLICYEGESCLESQDFSC